jgi:hypothetical protein
MVLPADPRYIDIAIGAIEALADRAGVDRDDVRALHAQVHEVIGARLARGDGATVTLLYEVGDGFLGVRVDGATSYAQT